MKRAGALILGAAALALALALPAQAMAQAVAQGTRPLPMRALVDGTGALVELPARPTRIIALAPELAELTHLLGAGESIVGRCEGCDRPASLGELPSVGPIVQPSPERILALRPDLVLASSQGNPLESLRRLRALGVPVFGVAPAARGMAGVLEGIRVVAGAVGRAERGNALACELEARLAAVREATAARPRVTACLIVWTDPIIVAGEGSFLEDLLDVAGADNACAIRGPMLGASGEYPRLSREDLLLARPDVLLLAIHAASPDAFEGWGASIPAVRDGRVIALEPDLYLRPTPALGGAAEALAAILAAKR